MIFYWDKGEGGKDIPLSVSRRLFFGATVKGKPLGKKGGEKGRSSEGGQQKKGEGIHWLWEFNFVNG